MGQLGAWASEAVLQSVVSSGLARVRGGGAAGGAHGAPPATLCHAWPVVAGPVHTTLCMQLSRPSQTPSQPKPSGSTVWLSVSRTNKLTFDLWLRMVNRWAAHAYAKQP
jgi:hypothetical protein